MLETSPFARDVVFQIGPVPITQPVVTTWAIMALLVAVPWLVLHAPGTGAVGRMQVALEILVETITKQLAEIVGDRTKSFVPLLGTMFIFLACANLAAVVPDVKPPTGHIETPAALAAVVFFSVHYFGIRGQGFVKYAKHYAQPSVLLLPLNLLSEITRTFSLMIRLFGNMMSHEFVLAIVVFLSGLLVPIPFMLLGIMIGLIQAYIFTVLATVYIAAAAGRVELE
jgi:F-type H+-transporting ATPase subunit a